MEKYNEEHIDVTKSLAFSWCVTKHRDDNYSIHSPEMGFPSIAVTKAQLLELYALIAQEV